jgi:hypothetical protein
MIATGGAMMSTSNRRLDRRSFVARLGGSALAAFAAPHVIAAPRHLRASVILGRDEHAYEMVHDWLTPPNGLLWGDTHGVAQDKAGRIYVAHTVNGSSTNADAVVVFDENGKFITSWGSEFRGGAHGLDVREEGGEEFLYHCDTNRRLVVKTNLKGDGVWTIDRAPDTGEYTEGMAWVPTNVAFAPNGDVYVGDGYGSSFIHRYTSKGEFAATIATPGSGPGQVSCPHGLWVDTRGSGEPRLAVADRGNRRIQYLTLDGTHLSFVTDGMRMPCHFKTRGDVLLVPDLESVVTLLDAGNEVITHLGDGHPSGLRGAPRDQFVNGKFVHPHSAIFLHTGDILVCEWVPIGRLTLLRKVH